MTPALKRSLLRFVLGMFLAWFAFLAALVVTGAMPI